MAKMAFFRFSWVSFLLKLIIMVAWTLRKLTLPLKFDWKIATGKATSVKTNYIVRIDDGEHKGEGEVAFSSALGSDKNGGPDRRGF